MNTQIKYLAFEQENEFELKANEAEKQQLL
jgi:hypothetical protein